MRDNVREARVFCTGRCAAVDPANSSTLRRAIFSFSARSMARNSAISAPETRDEARPSNRRARCGLRGG